MLRRSSLAVRHHSRSYVRRGVCRPWYYSTIGTVSSSGPLRSEVRTHRSETNSPSLPSISRQATDDGVKVVQARHLSYLPEFVSNVSLWGATGVIIKTFHAGGVPYWGCMSLTNVCVRLSLFPFVLNSAHTAARFAKVAPEIQFLVTIFQNDLKKQRINKAPFHEQLYLTRTTMRTVGAIYKYHKINPLAVFVSPLCQIPIFWYFSIDLRKIINGADPELAQHLTEGGMLWFPDLTDPDPWYGLPVLSGILLYYNVEVAIGKQSLSGETASKSNMALYLKDFFQSLAIFIPGFMSQSPAGVQIYLATSMLFTLGQGYALRSNTFRQFMGLPLRAEGGSATTGSQEGGGGELAKEFIQLKKLEHEAREAWGDVEMEGLGVMANGLKISFPGRRRKSTIQGSPKSSLLSYDQQQQLPLVEATANKTSKLNVAPTTRTPFIPGISALPEEGMNVVEETQQQVQDPVQPIAVMEEASEEAMERANRGMPPVKPKLRALPSKKNNKPLNMKRFKSKSQTNKKKGGSKRKR